MAQLVARLHGMQKVPGSNPGISTRPGCIRVQSDHPGRYPVMATAVNFLARNTVGGSSPEAASLIWRLLP